MMMNQKTNQRPSPSFAWCLAAMIALGAGCGKDVGPPRTVVSGSVAYGGKPVADGVIRFIPLPTSPVPTTGARIISGEYRADSHGGVPVGTYKVCIEAYCKPRAPASSGNRTPGPLAEPREQYLPKRYNVDTQLELTVESGGQAVTKNFDLAE
jgi:hypothetical protein